MSDAMPPQDGPSEEEVRAYLGQMRGAPVGQIVAEVVQGLLNAAQVKLGRKDGRLLIDIVGTINDQTRGKVENELTSQIDQALTQLRMAQVEAEREVGQAAAEGHNEPNDIGAAPAGAPGGQEAAPKPSGQQPATQQPSAPAQQPQQGESSPLNKLWIPGQ